MSTLSRDVLSTGEGHIGHRTDGDRGSVSLYLAIFSLAAFALLALLVDGGMAINAKERAADIAEQAARAAANQVDVQNLRAANPTVVIGPGACEAAANLVARYPVTGRTTARMTGCDAVVGATTATVQVSIQTSPVFPTFFGAFNMSSSASATPVCGITQGGQC